MKRRVAQATRLCRPATRRTEREGRPPNKQGARMVANASPIPVGESPTGAGGSPAPPIARVITKEDILYYVYGVLHSPEHRTRFASDLKTRLLINTPQP